jgi:UDP-2,3-diacylglucosamine pyrophosphatase LpxH
LVLAGFLLCFFLKTVRETTSSLRMFAILPALSRQSKGNYMAGEDIAALSRTIGEITPPGWLFHAEPKSFRPKRRFRTVWISDIHLGTKGCNAELLVDFLQSIECETLYLVGDIVDGWRLRKGWYWPDMHNEVVRRLLKMAHRGTRVIYIPGNHDEMFRDYAGLSFGGIELHMDAVHITADGRKLLVTHGDAFDGVVLYAKWLAFLGDHAYNLLLRANVILNKIRRRMELPYWSLSSHMKKRVKNAVQYVYQFEEAVAREAQLRGVDGVVCGHIHTAEIRQIGDITYYNDGDWVESCSALTEARDGTMALLDWAETLRDEAAKNQPKKQEAAI